MSYITSQNDRDWRKIDTLLLQNIDLPSIAYQANEKVPIVISYTHDTQNQMLGTGFASSQASTPDGNSDVFRSSAFFSHPSSMPSYELEFTGSRCTFRQASSTQSANSYEHMDLKGSLSVGNSFLGVSCQAEFNKDVQKNRDSTKVSLQYTLRIGRITPINSRRLSSEALELLRTSITDFHSTYGDYYLYSLNIGAYASTFLSTSSSVDLESEMRDIQVKAKLLFFNPTVFHDHQTSVSSTAAFDITHSGFDTLSKYKNTAHATDGPTYINVKTEAGMNVAGSIELEKRIYERLKGCGVEIDGEAVPLSEEQISKIRASGLVVDATFLPYARLKEYVSAVRDSRLSV